MSDGLGRYRTVLVLGGGSDIGLATAERLVGGGTKNVILAARRPDALISSADELRARGAEDVELVDFDALDLLSHASFLADLFERDRDIDLVLLTFGVLPDEAAAEKDRASRSRRRARTTSAPCPSCCRSPRTWSPKGTARSWCCPRPRPNEDAARTSCTARRRRALTRSAKGSRMICKRAACGSSSSRPGFVRSSMTRGLDPAPLATTPDDVARAIDDALSGSAPIIWVPAKLRWVMSGLRHLPRPVFRRLDL